ncbi:glycoside hydrolase family 2 [Paracoccus sp. R12_1]|uniref:glycoside hydrolase family 2 protein n=1 Tax=unclassified Paracoccus (in: a-proteobacteria) TaxID=2688777 RepID=UPI001ADAB919|nr:MULTISPECIES: glycoside hydrolase family 2 TIM barrel-domain containing protein [unclassified Paracoccus (in: a-proteobacteria)]MBO9456979.1 glycoside hydrolase family 2 [Paracoccus sp. R12_2]MBO9488072.1 glycoside hydrolase family 2 [Paracoccus sp. R12_1]
MLERSDLAENALAALHDEAYDRAYDRRDLTAQGMIFTGGRNAQSLDGDWNFCVDLLDTGLRQKWFAMQPGDPADRSLPWDYDPHMGETVPVPSNWQMLQDRWYFFEGGSWYTRPLDIEPDPEGRLFLRIGAASYDCKVFLNGVYLGNHLGASTPFFAELTDHVLPGRNWLMLFVDNRRRPDRLPMQNTDWFNYGGIYREVSLYRTPGTVIRDLFVALAPGCYDLIRAEIEVEGATEARLRIDGLVDQIIPLIHGRAVVEIAAKPRLWSTDDPHLYDVELTAGPDRVTDRVGFRQIERRGTEILLNGNPIWLRGIAVHEDDEKLGKVTNHEDLTRRFDHARALNCNFMRLAHYPHHEAASRMADERGILIWAEIPVYWAIDFTNPATRADARNQLAELVRRDRNRASVVIWSVGNENPDTDARLAFMSDLAALARQMDPTRLIAAACLVNHTTLRIEDRLAAHLDIIGINEYYGWYDKDFEDLETIGRNSDPDRPVVISETGADADITPQGPRTGLFSEAYQAEVYRRQIATLSRLDYVKGMSPWILYDFRTERRQGIYQRGWNRKGLVAADKTTRKEAFGILADFYARRAAGDA